MIKILYVTEGRYLHFEGHSVYFPQHSLEFKTPEDFIDYVCNVCSQRNFASQFNRLPKGVCKEEFEIIYD